MNNKASRKHDIDALVSKIKSQYANIEKLYNASLHKQEIGSDLKIEVKSYLENARSIFDYCAHDIAAVLDITKDNIYFPIVGKDKDVNSFDGSVNRNLPGLKSKSQNLFEYLESFQPYHEGNSWLADFSTVTNDHKHSQLTPQTKTDTQRMVSRHVDGRKASWDPNLATFGSGVFINDAQVNPLTQMPVSTPETIVTEEIWVDFRFDGTISALPLLKEIYDKVPAIVEGVYKLL